MKIEVNISKKYAFAIIGLLVVLISGLGVYAYNSGFSGGVPATFGHSSDEVNVQIGSTTKTLQAAITAGDLSGGSVAPERVKLSHTATGNGLNSASCTGSKKITGGGCNIIAGSATRVYSYPQDSLNPTSWICRYEGAAGMTIDIYAICV